MKNGGVCQGEFTPRYRGVLLPWTADCNMPELRAVQLPLQTEFEAIRSMIFLVRNAAEKRRGRLQIFIDIYRGLELEFFKTIL